MVADDSKAWLVVITSKGFGFRSFGFLGRLDLLPVGKVLKSNIRNYFELEKKRLLSETRD